MTLNSKRKLCNRQLWNYSHAIITQIFLARIGLKNALMTYPILS